MYRDVHPINIPFIIFYLNILGVAFQIQDDILNVDTNNPLSIGKGSLSYFIPPLSSRHPSSPFSSLLPFLRSLFDLSLCISLFN